MFRLVDGGEDVVDVTEAFLERARRGRGRGVDVTESVPGGVHRGEGGVDVDKMSLNATEVSLGEGKGGRDGRRGMEGVGEEGKDGRVWGKGWRRGRMKG